MSVLALLAAAIMPNVIRKIDRATWQRETSDLSAMANGLVQTILRDKQVPSQANIPVAAAKYLDLATTQVQTTPRNFSRVFLLDPNLNINGIVPGSLPYSQGSSGSSSVPANARVMIISTIAQPAVAANVSDFNTIWNTNPPQGSVVGITGGQRADD